MQESAVKHEKGQGGFREGSIHHEKRLHQVRKGSDVCFRFEILILRNKNHLLQPQCWPAAPRLCFVPPTGRPLFALRLPGHPAVPHLLRCSPVRPALQPIPASFLPPHPQDTEMQRLRFTKITLSRREGRRAGGGGDSPGKSTDSGG